MALCNIGMAGSHLILMSFHGTTLPSVAFCCSRCKVPARKQNKKNSRQRAQNQNNNNKTNTPSLMLMFWKPEMQKSAILCKSLKKFVHSFSLSAFDSLCRASPAHAGSNNDSCASTFKQSKKTLSFCLCYPRRQRWWWSKWAPSFDTSSSTALKWELAQDTHTRKLEPFRTFPNAVSPEKRWLPKSWRCRTPYRAARLAGLPSYSPPAQVLLSHQTTLNKLERNLHLINFGQVLHVSIKLLNVAVAIGNNLSVHIIHSLTTTYTSATNNTQKPNKPSKSTWICDCCPPNDLPP